MLETFRYNELFKLDQQFTTPFFILDKAVLHKNYQSIHNAFTSKYCNFNIAYSIKANYSTLVLSTLRELSCLAEVSSEMEYNIALNNGYKASNIIVNGPSKNNAYIKRVLADKGIINIDSINEFNKICDIAQSNPNIIFKVGLRLNLTTVESVSNIKNDTLFNSNNEESHFGIAISDTNFNHLKNLLDKLKNIHIDSLNSHLITKEKSPKWYKYVTSTLCDIAQKYFAASIKSINIGGGFLNKDSCQHYDNNIVPSFEDYAKSICEVLTTHKWAVSNKPNLTIEPGSALVCNSFSFITKVTDIKELFNKNIILTNGSILQCKPTRHKWPLPYIITRKNNDYSETSTFDVIGSTCWENDILFKNINDNIPNVDDYISIGNVGAYSLVLSPTFINLLPPIIYLDENKYKKMRPSQFLEDIYESQAITSS